MTMIRKLQTRLQENAVPATRDWWERYMKGVIPFRGVKMAGVRSALHGWHEEEAIHKQSPGLRKDLALALFREKQAEDKLAGILLLSEILLPEGHLAWRKDLPRFAALFQEGLIFDWNICDWFCVKVLGPLVEQEGEPCARGIARWCNAKNLWQRRASGVAFVKLAGRGEDNFPGFNEMLLEVCETTIQCAERFAQTGTGWVLRELGLADPTAVLRFIEEHLTLFSAEGLRYALEKMPAPVSKRLRAKHKNR